MRNLSKVLPITASALVMGLWTLATAYAGPREAVWLLALIVTTGLAELDHYMVQNYDDRRTRVMLGIMTVLKAALMFVSFNKVESIHLHADGSKHLGEPYWDFEAGLSDPLMYFTILFISLPLMIAIYELIKLKRSRRAREC